MPTYEYACAGCGNEFERFESIKSRPDKSCPRCHKKKAQRLISGGGGFIFKGSGFYLTDYKKHPGGTDQTEAKPAAKTDAKSDAPAATPCSGGGCACHPAPKPAKKSA